MRSEYINADPLGAFNLESSAKETLITQKPQHGAFSTESEKIGKSEGSSSISSADNPLESFPTINCELDREAPEIAFTPNTLKIGENLISNRMNPLMLQISNSTKEINLPYHISCRTLAVEISNSPFALFILHRISTHFLNIQKLVIIGTSSCNMNLLNAEINTIMTFPNLNYLKFEHLAECTDFFSLLAKSFVTPRLVDLEFQNCFISEKNIKSHEKIAGNVKNLFYFDCKYQLESSESQICNNMQIKPIFKSIGKFIQCARPRPVDLRN